MLDDCLARPAESDRWFDGALQAVQLGAAVVWATIRRSDGRFVGSTRFMEIRRPHRSLEIANTWLRRDAQRTAINTEAKYLQLRHAFDGLGAVRVEFKIDERNLASRQAIVRIGATPEGILRCYQTRPDGFVRNTAFYGMTAGDWPGVRAALEARLVG